ncbi:MAG: hypothetical protein PHS41_01875 [Victivallaceae bacterium]|nr:hypothetical protein [Victivallaceae bacterium]
MSAEQEIPITALDPWQHTCYATAKAATMLLTGLTGFVLWKFLHHPSGDFVFVMGPALSSISAFDERNFLARVRVLFTGTFLIGVLQFLLSVFWPTQVPLMLVMFCAVFLVASQLRHPVLATAILTASYLTFSGSHSYLEGFNRFCALQCAGFAGIWVIAIQPWMLPHRCCYPPRPEPISTGNALRMAAVTTVGLFCARVLRWPESHWMISTANFCYMGGAMGRIAYHKAATRFLLAAPGFVIGMLLVANIGFFNYQMTYLFILFGFLAYFIQFRYNHYGWSSFCFFIFFAGISNFLAATEYSGYNLIFSSAIACMIGGLLVLVSEFSFDR